MNLLFTALIVVWAAWLILKKYKPQTVLFVAGGLLLAGSMIHELGHDPSRRKEHRHVELRYF